MRSATTLNDAAILHARIDGETVAQVAERFGICERSVRRACARQGISFCQKVTWTPELLSELRRLRVSGLTVLQLSEALGIGRDMVRAKCVEFGLNKRRTVERIAV